MNDPADFIRAHLPIAPVPALPDIRLHRAGPKSGLRRLSAAGGPAAGSPYWAFPWPGGLALARYMTENPACVAGRRVLDLGAGSGLVGIAAAKAGAAAVTASETDRNALAALSLNASVNRVAIRLVAEDLLSEAPPSVDVVMAGDLFYDRTLARRVTGFLDRCLGAGCTVLIGDPGRPYLPSDRLRPIAEYDVCEVGGSPQGPLVRSSVFAFETTR